jgi:hypothetical protein
MNSRFLLSTLLVTALGLAILSLVPIHTRAQTGDRKNDAKATAGSSFGQLVSRWKEMTKSSCPLAQRSGFNGALC